MILSQSCFENGAIIAPYFPVSKTVRFIAPYFPGFAAENAKGCKVIPTSLFVDIPAGLQLPVGGVENLLAGDVKFSGQGFGQSSGALYLAVGWGGFGAVGYRADSDCLA